MIAVILAAGKGTRMGDLTRVIPKPLLPVAGVPILERIVLGLKSASFSEFVIVIGYLGEAVRTYFGDGARLGIRIKYVDQQFQEGTARALLLCQSACGCNDLLLTFADILTSPENYTHIKAVFERDNCHVIGGIRRVEDPHKGAAVYLDSDWNVLRMVEKPARGTSSTPWNHAGLYCFRPVIFDYLQNVRPSPRQEYEMADAVMAMIEERKVVKAVELTGYWRDLATPEDIHAVEAFLT